MSGLVVLMGALAVFAARRPVVDRSATPTSD
jgi:hypothetical protein